MFPCYLPRVAHHNGDNSVHQRQRDCHTLGKPSGLMVRCLAETMGERPCFAFACLSKYEKDTMPSYLTRCWKATKHLRGTRTRCFSRKLSVFPRNCRSEPHGVIRMYDWSNVMKGLQPSSTLAPFLVPCQLQSSYSNIPANMLVLAPSGAGLPKNKTVLDDWAIC